ncbi:hypothetical protein QE406_002069 [Microbacterium testaceum]|uniref:hypothetical protein n=1 Tax=Microbacterium testaceum TaxID=2033 RepID=UPI002785B6B6|nr:hypothetical protein [Microbacterium testaceum]MDQ1116060.1 hypothetical protein [Microbacterium testaceum]
MTSTRAFPFASRGIRNSPEVDMDGVGDDVGDDVGVTDGEGRGDEVRVGVTDGDVADADGMASGVAPCESTSAAATTAATPTSDAAMVHARRVIPGACRRATPPG